MESILFLKYNMWSTTRVNIRTITIPYIYINDLGAVLRSPFPLCMQMIFPLDKNLKKMVLEITCEQLLVYLVLYFQRVQQS